MKWMEARREMELFFRHTPTTFYTFINRPARGDRADIFICRGFPQHRLSGEGALITLWDANKSRKVHIFENPIYAFDWQWYPESLILLRSDPVCTHPNATYEELFHLGNEES